MDKRLVMLDQTSINSIRPQHISTYKCTVCMCVYVCIDICVYGYYGVHVLYVRTVCIVCTVCNVCTACVCMFVYMYMYVFVYTHVYGLLWSMCTVCPVCICMCLCTYCMYVKVQWSNLL